MDLVKLQEIAQRLNIPLEPLLQQLEVRNAISLSPQFEDKNRPLGTSRIGGAPDLPAGFQWPTEQQVMVKRHRLFRKKETIPVETSLGFVAQLNCAELALHDEA
ncbi:MAG: DUF1963 domain-containing protein [Phaeodactylibacter sp.]|nr:DUF1963 domain-containing protein [Phaeodactylibacter sp.]